tara:strand:+ start:16801 stop:17346 length:546 start_codon:yes stop_codon:yes gene_type:complete
MRQSKLAVFALAVSLLSAGCATTSKDATEYNTVDMSEIDVALLQSAKAIQSSIKIMEENKNFLASKSKSEEEVNDYAEQINTIPNGLDVPINMNDRLPLQKIVELIGYLTNYQVLTVNPPQNDISKSVRVYGRPAIYVLRDLGMSLKDDAHIAVMPFLKPKPDGMLGIVTITYSEVLGAGR